MVRDENVMRAVSRVLQRSERQEDLQKLLGTFVDVGILPQLNNRNNQIFYGRRGTGKTHVFKVLDSQLRESKKNVVVYIDARTLGSTAQYSDPSIPLRQRCLALFRDILLEIHHALLEHIFEHPLSNADKALEALDSLVSTITDDVKSFHDESITETSEKQGTSSTNTGISANTSGNFGVQASITQGGSDKKATSTSYDVAFDEKVIFPDLNRYLSKTLKLADAYLYILLDEWSSLTPDIQPYLAEFLKRGVLTVNRATLKIASLEYRSRFARINEEPIIGFELGADIATAPDLDDTTFLIAIQNI